MAFWGAPVADDNQAVRACAAALEIVRQCRQLQGLPGAETGFEVRIGIETGTAVVGYVGSPNRLNYTAIGDVVNVASRMENLNKYYRTAILIGEDARALAGDAILVREIDRTVVPGRATAISVYEPVGRRDTPRPLALPLCRRAARLSRPRFQRRDILPRPGARASARRRPCSRAAPEMHGTRPQTPRPALAARHGARLKILTLKRL